MFKWTKKSVSVVAGGVLALGVAGSAFAYVVATQAGSGSGTVTTDSTLNEAGIVFSVDVTGDDIVNDGPLAVSYSATNSNKVGVHYTTMVPSVTAVTKSDGSPIASCAVGDFVLSSVTAASGVTLIDYVVPKATVSGGVTTNGSITLGSATLDLTGVGNQTACQHAKVTISISATNA